MALSATLKTSYFYSRVVVQCVVFCELIVKHVTVCKGHAVAQLVEALRYKPEGRGFDSRWCHWNFSLT